MKERIVFLAVAIAILSIGFANAACYINVVEENKSQYEGDLNATMIINNQTTPYSAEIELANETLDVFPNATMTTILLNVPVDQIESASSEAGNWSVAEIDEQGQTNTIIMAEIDENAENISGPVTINFNDSWNGTLPENEEGYVIAVDIENIGEMGNDSAWVTLGFCDDNVTDGNVTPPGGNGTDGNVTPPGDNVTDGMDNVTNVTTCYLNTIEENKTQYEGDLNATMMINNETTPYTAEFELTNATQDTFPNATLTTIVLNVPADQIVNANDSLGNEWEIMEIVEEEPNPFGNFTTMLTINEDMMNPFGQFITKITMNESANATGPVTVYFNDSWNGTFPQNEEGYVVAADIEDIGEMGNDSAWVTLGFCDDNVTDGNVTPPGGNDTNGNVTPPGDNVTDGNVTPPGDNVTDGNVTPPGDNDTNGNVTPPGDNVTDGMENITMCYINDVEDNKTQYEGDLNATMMINNETAPYFIEIELTNETLDLFPNTTIETILFNIPAEEIDNVTAAYGNWSLVDLNNTTVIERFEANESNNTSGPITIYMNDTWNGTLPANAEGYVIATDFQNIGEMGNDSAWVTLGFCLANVTDENVTDENATAQVDIVNESYDPETTTIMAGETVTWMNMDEEAHTVTDEDGTFDSGEIAPGASFNYTFEEAGTYDYYCTIHPEMSGSVIVEENSA